MVSESELKEEGKQPTVDLPQPTKARSVVFGRRKREEVWLVRVSIKKENRQTLDLPSPTKARRIVLGKEEKKRNG